MHMKKISSLIFICILAGIPVRTFALTSNVAKIVFTTESRTADVGALSEAITIQAQNSSGSEEKLDSTADVIFTTTSATGEFLGSTGKAVTKTMNSGSANKTFYYKDSTEGAFTLTVQVVPRTGGAGWSASQIVYIGTTVGEGTDTGDTDENTGENSDSQTQHDDDTGDTKVESNNSGSHTSTAKLTSFISAAAIKIGAGRPRTVLVNTPIYFEAEINQVSKKIKPKLKYEWSYGDGDSDVGEKARHVYYFPGDYNVVLNGRYKDQEYVSRTKVKVVDNLVTVASSSPGADGFVEIKNNSSSEINVNGWEIRSNDREYIISADTIIAAKSSIRVPNKVMHFEPADEIDLIFPTRELAYRYDVHEHASQNIQQQTATLKTFESPAAFIEDLTPMVTEESTSTEETHYATTVQAAAVAVPKRGFWSFVKSFFSVE